MAESDRADEGAASEAEPPSERDRAHALASGLYDANAVTFLGAVGLALVEFVLFLVFATPHHLANLSPWLAMRHPRDDYARVTMLAHRLHARAGKGGPLSVLYLGSSVAQRALYDSWDPRPIEGALAKRVGEHVDFYSAYASSETIHEAELVAQYVPEGFRGLVTMVVFDDKDDDLSFQSALAQSPGLQERLALDPIDPSAPRLSIGGKRLGRTGIYFLDHLQFFSARREFLLHPWVVWKPYPRGGYHGRTPPKPKVEEEQLIRRIQRPHPLLNHERDLLARLVEESKKNGATVVLLEAPQNKRYQAVKGVMHGEYDASIRAFAAEHGVEYWDFNPELKLKRSDFEDAVHLGSPRQRFRFQKLYCWRVADKLREIEGKRPLPRPEIESIDEQDDDTSDAATTDQAEPMVNDGEGEE